MHGELAVGVERDVALTRIQVTQIDTHTFFAGHQMNAVGIHPAQSTGIHCHCGDAAFTLLCLQTAIGIHPVSPGDNIQIFRMNCGVDLGCPRDDRQCITIAGVDPLAFDGDAAFFHVQCQQITVGIKDRFTGGQRGLWCIDEAAAVTGNTIRIRHHDVCCFTRHFGVTL